MDRRKPRYRVLRGSACWMIPEQIIPMRCRKLMPSGTLPLAGEPIPTLVELTPRAVDLGWKPPGSGLEKDGSLTTLDRSRPACPE